MKPPLRAFPARPQAVFKMPSERYFYFSDGLFYSLSCSMAANFSGSLRTCCAV